MVETKERQTERRLATMRRVLKELRRDIEQKKEERKTEGDWPEKAPRREIPRPRFQSPHLAA